MDSNLASVYHISDCSTSDEIMRKLPSKAESLILEQKQNVDFKFALYLRLLTISLECRNVFIRQQLSCTIDRLRWSLVELYHVT